MSTECPRYVVHCNRIVGGGDAGSGTTDSGYPRKMSVDEVSDFRVEERLRIKIGEAKNLPARSHGSVGTRDTFCALSLDREEIFRTATAEKTLCPYFGEEFQFEVPRKFRHVSLYIYDRDKAMRQVKVIGKVAIKKEDLSKYNGKDHWFPIVPVDADSEVQGKVHVAVRLDRYPKSTGHGNGLPFPKLQVRILEGSDLAIINGACDPYAMVTLWYGPNKQESKRTKVRKKTVNPQFDDIFTFELFSKSQTMEPNIFNLVEDDVGRMELRVAVFHESSGVSGPVFLGEIRMSLNETDLLDGEHDAWYFLKPRGNTNASTACARRFTSKAASAVSNNKSSALGSLRLRIQYTSDHVLSSHFYDPLRNLLLLSVDAQLITSSAAYILGEMTLNKVEAAQPLVKIFMRHNRMVPFIKALAKWEISKVTDTNTVFRGNTLLSKCMDEFMKLAGHHYLQDTLKASLDQIFSEHRPCEIDPCKTKDGQCIQTNMENLREYVEQIFKAITNSAVVCPPVMCEVFSVLKDLATAFFPDRKEVRYSVVSGFVFLRFFAPAILGPKLFELSTEPVDPQTNRTLTLISKTIQSLGNLVSCKSVGSQQIFKEDYMVTMYKDFITDKHVNDIRVFLEIISSSSSASRRNIDSPIILKEGVMIKRAQGRKRFGVKNFKKRYFCLSTQDFTYSKRKGATPLCRISVDQILAVERLQEESFKMKNMFQIIQPERALYIQASNCVEGKEWIDILTKVCHSNKHRLMEFHPGAFVNGHWQCCKGAYESAPGCHPVTGNGVPADIKVHIDSDHEVERVHSLFLANMDKLDKLVDACDRDRDKLHAGENNNGILALPVNTGQASTPLSGPLEDPRNSCFKTLRAIQNCVLALRHEHVRHVRHVYRHTKYGSEHAPIGDDNYLLMAGLAAATRDHTSFNRRAQLW